LLAVTALMAPTQAGARDLNQFIGFGDSTMDSGYFRYNTTGSRPDDAVLAYVVARGASGAFAGPGRVDTTLLAARFGLTATPVGIPGGGGTNFANGAARTVATYAVDGQGFPANVPTVTEIANYLAVVGNAANPHALYMISTGANDLLWVQGVGAGVAPPNFLTTQAGILATNVAALQAAGARTIVMLNVYDYARLVGPDGYLSPASAADIAQAQTYSATIWSSLTAAGVNFIPADVEGVLKYVSQHPTSFGFSPATELSTVPACLSPKALLCTPADLRTPNAEQTYLFADADHLTTAGQTIEVDYIASLLAAPGQISLIAESAVQNGLARMATIQAQIELSGQQRGPNRINVWASAGVSSQDIKTTTGLSDASGTPVRGTVGADYQLDSGLILGAAVTAGGQSQKFSAGGHFDQTDEALSLYAAYRTGPVWGNAVASYGMSQVHVARQVALGRFLDQNSGDTDGQAWALALRGGYDIQAGPVTTGPVAGVVLQQIQLDGFTEGGTSGITALRFGSQTRNSAITQLGWRGSVALGDWQPFAEIAWNHEWSNTSGKITTALTSIAAAPWSALGAPIASDWASATVGTTWRLTPQVTLRGAFSAMMVNPQVNSFGGELGVTMSF
jgi:outer membrane lipase/esterase